MSSRRRVTYGQLELMSEILAANTDVALGFNKAAHARARSRLVWEQYWVDYKAKLKRKAAMARADRTGGGPNLSDIEEKFLQLLVPNSDVGLPGARVDPFPDAQRVEELVPKRVPVLEAGDAMSTVSDLDPALEEEFQEYYVIGADDGEQSQSAQTPAEVTPANDTPAAAARARSRRRRRGDTAPPVSVYDARRSVISSNSESVEIMRGILTELRRLTDLASVALERFVPSATPRGE